MVGRELLPGSSPQLQARIRVFTGHGEASWFNVRNRQQQPAKSCLWQLTETEAKMVAPPSFTHTNMCGMKMKMNRTESELSGHFLSRVSSSSVRPSLHN